MTERTGQLVAESDPVMTGTALGTYRFCAECGQLTDPPIRDIVRQSSQERRVWPWLTVALGAYLVVTFGLGGWKASEMIMTSHEAIRAASWLEADLAADVAGYRERMDRDFVIAAVGLVAIFVGLSAWLRALILRPIDRGGAQTPIPAAGELRARLANGAVVAWTFGEAVVMSVFQSVVVIASCLTIVRAGQGEPLTWRLPADALGRAIDLIVSASRLAGVPELPKHREVNGRN